jgi:ATP-binding cassette subfamily B (MDR/TAP) protein 1
VGDGGIKLSGGQKQRLAIARSIVKKPPIIILDEATSAIDVKSERIVQAAIDRISTGRTTIVIAHRLSTIKKAHKIIVLDRGRVVESGTHQALVEKPNGVYRALAQAQELHMTAGETRSDKQIIFDAKEIISDLPVEVVSREETLDKKNRGILGSFGKLLYEQRIQWPSYLGMVGGAACVAAGTPLQAWLFAKVIGLFLLSRYDVSDEASFWGLMWLALAGGVGLSYFTLGWFSLRAQNLISATYKGYYLKDMLYQRLSFFDKEENSHGSLASRVSGDAKLLEELLGLNLAFLISGVLTVVGCSIVALSFSWKLGLLATFVTLPLMVGTGFWKFRYELQFDQMNSRVFAESSQFASEAIGAMRTVSALTMEDSINNRYKTLLNGHVDAAFRKSRWTSILYGFADSISIGCQALVFWYGGRLLANGEIGMESFFVCFMAIVQGAESASQALAIAPNAAQAIAAANRILDVRETVHLETASRDFSSDEDGGVRVEARDVSFRYPSRDIPVLQSMNLGIEKGQYVALVGASGSGKSTIVSLLLRFYDVTHGSILWNDTDIKDLDLYQYRHEISLVAQEPTMFEGSVRSNVLLGVADPSAVSEEQLRQVCRDAFIDEFVSSLPEGYDTDVGQRGVSLSGGQKQRIALARALIRNPRVLLLDEATSALDSESERIVQEAVEKASRGRTTIAIAHRIATIQNADVIFVVDHGSVVERGSHSELIQKRGIYFEMCQGQALDL